MRMSPIIVGAIGAASATICMVVTISTSNPLFGIIGGILGLVLAITSIVLSLQSSRTMRVGLYALVFSVVSLGFSFNFEGDALQADSGDRPPSPESLKMDVLGAEGRVQRLQTEIKNLPSRWEPIRPELLDKVTIESITLREGEKQYKRIDGSFRTEEIVVLDASIQNETGIDFDSVALWIEHPGLTNHVPRMAGHEGPSTALYHSSNIRVVSGETTIVTFYIGEKRRLSQKGVSPNDPFELSKVPLKASLHEAKARNDNGGSKTVTSRGPTPIWQEIYDGKQKELDRAYEQLAEKKAALEEAMK